jgi:hypothetical protein
MLSRSGVAQIYQRPLAGISDEELKASVQRAAAEMSPIAMEVP